MYVVIGFYQTQTMCTPEIFKRTRETHVFRGFDITRKNKKHNQRSFST